MFGEVPNVKYPTLKLEIRAFLLIFQSRDIYSPCLCLWRQLFVLSKKLEKNGGKNIKKG